MGKTKAANQFRIQGMTIGGHWTSESVPPARITPAQSAAVTAALRSHKPASTHAVPAHAPTNGTGNRWRCSWQGTNSGPDDTNPLLTHEQHGRQAALGGGRRRCIRHSVLCRWDAIVGAPGSADAKEQHRGAGCGARQAAPYAVHPAEVGREEEGGSGWREGSAAMSGAGRGRQRCAVGCGARQAVVRCRVRGAAGGATRRRPCTSK